jgi:hypothetical protein
MPEMEAEHKRLLEEIKGYTLIQDEKYVMCNRRLVELNGYT